MALLVPNEKCHILFNEFFFIQSKNAPGYYPGPVTPSTADEDPFLLFLPRNSSFHLSTTRTMNEAGPAQKPTL